MKQELKNSIEIHKKNKDYVGADDSVRPIPKRDTQKGITLVALVVTIIVLMILAVVSIKLALDGGLTTKAKQATQLNTENAEIEAIQTGYAAYQVELTQKGIGTFSVKDAVTSENGETWTVTFETGNTYTINDSGKITGPIEKTEDDIKLEKYALGNELKGQSLMNLMNEDGTGFKELNGKEVELLNLAAYTTNYGESTAAIYVKYNNKAYRILIDFNGGHWSDTQPWKTKSVAMVYEPKGKEGETVTYSYDGTKENEKQWRILYDNKSDIEIISPNAMGTLTLGYEDEMTQGNNNWEKAVYSYNHAIERLNSYSEKLITNSNKNSVRSAGSNPSNPNYKNTLKHTSELLENWDGMLGSSGPKIQVNSLIDCGENNYEQDLVRMSYWGISEAENNIQYFMASRFINTLQLECNYAISTVQENGGDLGQQDLLAIYLAHTDDSGSSYEDSADARNSTCAVRPIVKINN